MNRFILWAIIGSTLLLTQWRSRLEASGQTAKKENAAEVFLTRIQQLRVQKDLAAMQRICLELKTEWLARKDIEYCPVILELCLAMNSVPGTESGRYEAMRDLAISVLDSPGEKPPDVVARLAMLLQSDPEYSKGDLRGDQWMNERQVRVERWLNSWKFIRDKLKKAPGPSGPMYMYVDPPEGLPDGVGPSAVKDPVLRKRYEEAIERNNQNHVAYNTKRDLVELEKNFASRSKRYIIEAYCKPPFSEHELEIILERHKVDKETRTAMVEEVRRRSAGQIERDAKFAKLSPVAKISNPPPTTVIGADPRLRVKLSVNFKVPLVEEVLSELRKATGVALARADDIQNQYYVSGSYSFTEVPAWQIMETLASSKYVQGEWQTDGQGYRLVRNGNPVAEPSAPPTVAKGAGNDFEDGPGASMSNFAFWLTVVPAIAILVLVLTILWRRWHNARQTAK